MGNFEIDVKTFVRWIFPICIQISEFKLVRERKLFHASLTLRSGSWHPFNNYSSLSFFCIVLTYIVTFDYKKRQTNYLSDPISWEFPHFWNALSLQPPSLSQCSSTRNCWWQHCATPGLLAIHVLHGSDEAPRRKCINLAFATGRWWVGGCPQTCLLPLQTIAHCQPLHWWINIVTVLGIFQMHFWDLESTW